MELPNENMRPNVYGQSKGPASKSKIADAFAKAGWSSGKCAWYDYEIENNFVELIIEGDDYDNLIHGYVLDAGKNIPKIGKLLEDLGLSWSFEEYDQDQNEIAVYSSNQISKDSNM